MTIGVEDLISYNCDVSVELMKLLRAESRKYSDPNDQFGFGKGSGLLLAAEFIGPAIAKAVELKNEREGK